MYQIQRVATFKNASLIPKAIGWSAELTGYVNKNYKGFELRFGVEMFGQARMHWLYKSDTLEHLEKENARLLQDTKYWALVEAGKDFFVEGSLKDTIVMVVG